MRGRLWAGAALLAVGLAVSLLPWDTLFSGLTLMGFGVLCLADRFFEKHGWKRGWRRLTWGIGIAVFVLLAGGMTLVGLGGRSQWDAARQSEYAVVLGAQIRGDDPSPTLARRLEVGLQYLQENAGGILIVSGGQGPDEDRTEASVMYDYLEARGADMTRVYREEDSHNTRQNLENSAALAASLGIDPSSPTIISSEYHLCRAKYIASTLGLAPSALGSETTPWLLKANYLLREVFAFVKAWAVAGRL